MLRKFFDYNLWFTQPSIVLSQPDLYLGYFFAACLIISIVLKLSGRLTKNQIKTKLMNKFFYLLLTTGLSGLVWFGFRYENTPIFAMRAWAGGVLLVGLIWFLYILKYLFFHFFAELKEYDHELIKNKYIPGPKNR